MKKFLLLLVLALLAMFCYSQNISDYSFSSSTEAFSSIYAIVGGPPSVDWSNGGDDELSASIPIGFSFPFCGSNYTSVKISTNGFITLGTGLTSSYPTNNLAGTYSAPIIAPLWDDLLSWAAWPNASTTYVMYQNTITNQFKVEWRSVRWNYTGNSTFSQNFQLTLLSTGVIRFNYGSSGTTNNPSASIGITHNGQFISVTPNTSYSSTTANNNITTLPTGRRFSFTPPAPQPNLVIQNLSINPTTAGQGTQITVSYRIKNIGSATASSSDTFIYFDPDNIYGNANATQLYRHTEGSLAPNAYYDRQFSVNIPSTAPTGTRYIWVCADDIFYVNESNEDDNRVYTPITITQSLPDLVIDTYYCSVSPNSASPGSTVTISYRIRNIGSVNAGGSHTYFYFSNDNNINSNDYYLGYVSEPAIAAGGYRDWTKSVTIPTEALSGVRYLGIIADANNSVTESSESNNGGGLQITIIQNPSLSANPTALNFGNVPLYTMPYLSYQLTGSNLTGNVTVSIPSNLPMNISTSQNGTYSTTLTVVPTGGNVNQAIWVRFNPMFAQTYNATINNTSGALSVPVSVTGTGVSPTLAVNPTSLAFGPVTINTNSTPQSYNLTGSNLTANVTVTAPTGYRVASSQTGTYNQTLTVNQSGGSVNTTIWVRFQPTAVQTYNSNVNNVSGNVPANVAVTGQGVNTPTLSVSPPSLAFGQQQINTNSTPQSYNLTGSNLTTSVTVTAPTGYRVATTQNGTYNQSLTVTPSSGSVNTTIWVRFQPTAVQTFNGNVTNVSGSASANVSVTGAGINQTTPVLSVNPASLAFGNVVINTNSTPQSYNLTGSNLTTNVSVSAPTGYRVSTTQNGTYSQTLTVNQSGGSVNATIWVRFQPTAVQSYTGNVTNTSTGATTVNVAVSGIGVSGSIPSLSVNPSSLSFGNVTVDTNSPPQSYNLTGSNLTTNVSVSAPTGYRVSTTQNGTYSQTLTVNQSGGSVNATIWVRFQPTAVQSYTGNVTNTSTGATAVNVAVSGIGTSTNTSYIDLSQFVTGLPAGQTFSGQANNAVGINDNKGFDVFYSAANYPTSVLKYITVNSDMTASSAQSAFPNAANNMGNPRVFSTGDYVYLMGLYISGGRDPLYFNKYNVQANTMTNVSIHESWPTDSFSDIEPLDIMKSSNGKVYIINEWRYVSWSVEQSDLYMRVSSDDMVSWGPWIQGEHIGGEGMIYDAMMIEGSDNHIHIALWTTWGGTDKVVYFKFSKASDTFVQRTVLGSGKNASVFLDGSTNKLCMTYLNPQGQAVYRTASLSNTNTWSTEQVALSQTGGTWGISSTYANGPYDQGRHLYLWTSDVSRQLIEWDGNSSWSILGNIPSTMPEKRFERSRMYRIQNGDLHIVQGYKDVAADNYFTRIERYQFTPTDNSDEYFISPVDVVRCYPNPFNPTTTIAFDLEKNNAISVDIFNISGQRVRRLAQGYYSAGSHNLVWNGENDNNQILPSGVYMIKINLGNRVLTKKVTMMK